MGILAAQPRDDRRNTGEILPPEPTLENVRSAIRKVLLGQTTPTASELLADLLEEFGWRARLFYRAAVMWLSADQTIPYYVRPYLTGVLSDANVVAALRGNARDSQAYQSTLQELFARSADYRKSAAFREAIEFAARFREYAPFNNMLVRVQNPSCSYYATARDWQARFGRGIKEDARPMLILAPMHPVMLVYDLDSTDGPPLPEHLRSFARVDGEWDGKALERLMQNADRQGIQVQVKPLSQTNAGKATNQVRDARYKMRVVLHDKLDDKAQYATLCHELAHILLGHLGTDADSPWPLRSSLTHTDVEIEAEAVAYIVSVRMGLRPGSEAYLSSYITGATIPATVSMELICKVASRLLEMSERLLPPRKAKPAQ